MTTVQKTMVEVAFSLLSSHIKMHMLASSPVLACLSSKIRRKKKTLMQIALRICLLGLWISHMRRFSVQPQTVSKIFSWIECTPVSKLLIMTRLAMDSYWKMAAVISNSGLSLCQQRLWPLQTSGASAAEIYPPVAIRTILTPVQQAKLKSRSIGEAAIQLTLVLKLSIFRVRR